MRLQAKLDTKYDLFRISKDVSLSNSKQNIIGKPRHPTTIPNL